VGSPITFSGFNDIDFNVVLNSLMAQASQPLTALQSRQAALKSQTTTFDALAARVSALETAAHALATASGVQTLAATSTDAAAVAVTADLQAVAGHFDVVVNELARAQVTATAVTLPDANTTVVATGGTLDIGGVTVTVAGSVTLEQLAQQINDTAGIGVHAQVVRTGATAYRLALTANATGLASAFTVSHSLSGGAGLTFADADNDGVSGDTASDNAVTASDAAILINNIAATSASNTFDNVVTGVTLTVLRKDPVTTVGVDIAPDSAALSAKVDAFVTAYNAMVTFVGEQRAAAGRGEAASIGRDPVLRQVASSLRSGLLGSYGTGAFTHLADIGVELTRQGTLTLDKATFDAAVASDGDAVRELFAGPGGVFPELEDLLGTFADATGSIPASKTQLERQISTMDAEISRMQERLALQRAALQRQFTEADLAMSRLRSQSSALGSFGGGLGGL
jgi:flagellar hook-associated protein 2